MRILVTGGTGYLGGALLRLGLEQKLTLAATNHQQPPTASRIPWYTLDILDKAKLQQAMEHFHPDVVIHTAFRKSDRGWQRVIVEGTANVAEASHAAGAHLIHLSTDAVFDGEKTDPYSEADPPSPITEYGQAKLEAEHAVQQKASASTVVRTSLIWGLEPLDPTSQTALDLARGTAQGVLFADEYRSFVYAPDLAAAILELSERPYQGVLHVGGPDPLSRAGFGRLIAQHFGPDPSLIPVGSARDHPTPRPLNCVLDSSRATGLLRTRLRGVREVLAVHDG